MFYSSENMMNLQDVLTKLHLANPVELIASLILPERIVEKLVIGAIRVIMILN